MLAPEHALAKMNKHFPNLWKEVDAHRARYSKSWPGWCFFPGEEMGSLLDWHFKPPPNDDERMRQMRLTRYATILAPWRVSKNVYRFDPDIYSEVIKTSLKGPLPVDWFFRMPEWAVFIETPGLEAYSGRKFKGFVASLNFYQRDNNDVKLTMLSFDEENLPFIDWLYVKEGLTIEESLALSHKRGEATLASMKLSYSWETQDGEDSISHVTKLLNLLLYICQTNSEHLDIRNSDGSDRLPRNPLPRKTKKGLRYFPPAKPTVWECGFRQGAQLRRARALQALSKGGTHASPTPHIRAAHWHTYITGKGSRKDPSKAVRVLKWIHPVLVNVDKGDLEDIVIRKVN